MSPTGRPEGASAPLGGSAAAKPQAWGQHTSDEAVRVRIAATVRADVQVLERYHVPDARGYVKLDAMENPYIFCQPGASSPKLRSNVSYTLVLLR